MFKRTQIFDHTNINVLNIYDWLEQIVFLTLIHYQFVWTEYFNF